MSRLIAILLFLPLSVLGQIRVVTNINHLLSLKPSNTQPWTDVQGHDMPGDWGAPKRYRWDPSSSRLTNDIALADPSGIPGRYLHNWDGDAAAFGALITASNIAPALLAAVTEAISTNGNGTVRLNPGTYRSDNLIITNDCAGLTLDLGAAEIWTGITAPIIWIQGKTVGVSYAPSASVPESSLTIPMQSTAGLAAGNWVVIHEDTSHQGGPFHQGDRYEHNLIAEVTATNITLASLTRYDYRTNFTVGIYPMTGPRSVRIFGGRLFVPASLTNTVNATGVRIDGTYGAHVNGLRTLHCGGDGGILVYRSGHTQVGDCRFFIGRGVTLGGTGYGLSVVASHDVYARSLYQVGTRESVVSDSCFVVFDGFDSDSTFDSGLNTHGSFCKNVVFRNCNVNQSRGIGILASFSGSVGFDKTVSIENCTVWAARRIGIGVYASPGNKVRGVTVRGCTLRNCEINANGQGALYLSQAVDAMVSDCQFIEGPAAVTPIVYASDCSRLWIRNCVLANNRNKTIPGMRIDRCNGLRIEDVIWRDNPSLTRALRVLDCYRVGIERCQFAAMSSLPTRLTTGDYAIGLGGITSLLLRNCSFNNYFVQPLVIEASTNRFAELEITGNSFPPAFRVEDMGIASQFGGGLVKWGGNRSGNSRSPGEDLIGVLYGADFNSTNIQDIPLDGQAMQIDRIAITSASTSLAASPAVARITQYPQGTGPVVVSNIVFTNLVLATDVGNQLVTASFTNAAMSLASASGASSLIASNVIVYNGHGIKNGQTIWMNPETENGLPHTIPTSGTLIATNVLTDSFGLALWRGAAPEAFLPCERKSAEINPNWDVVYVTAHGYTNGATIWFTGDDVPLGASAYPATYSVTNATVDSFQVASGGSVVDFTSEGFNVVINRSSLMPAIFDPATDTFTFPAAHGILANGRFSMLGTAPAGLVVNRQYFAKNITSTTLQASATSGGVAIDGTDAGADILFSKDRVGPMARPTFSFQVLTPHGSVATGTVMIFGKVRR